LNQIARQLSSIGKEKGRWMMDDGERRGGATKRWRGLDSF
jgi:hypothetical protein